MRPLLHVPADPRRQRTILVVLVHRRQVAPLLLAAEELHQARLEVDPEPLPLQHEDGRARRRLIETELRTDAARREKDRQQRGLEEHAVRLIAGESCAAPTNDRKQMPAIAIESRGPTLITMAIDAASPIQTMALSIASLALNQSSVGAYQ